LTVWTGKSRPDSFLGRVCPWRAKGGSWFQRAQLRSQESYSKKRYVKHRTPKKGPSRIIDAGKVMGAGVKKEEIGRILEQR